jgi:hypothetical protein
MQYFAEAGNGRFELSQCKLLNIQNPAHLAHVTGAVTAESLPNW